MKPGYGAGFPFWRKITYKIANNSNPSSAPVVITKEFENTATHDVGLLSYYFRHERSVYADEHGNILAALIVASPLPNPNPIHEYGYAINVELYLFDRYGNYVQNLTQLYANDCKPWRGKIHMFLFPNYGIFPFDHTYHKLWASGGYAYLWVARNDHPNHEYRDEINVTWQLQKIQYRHLLEDQDAHNTDKETKMRRVAKRQTGQDKGGSGADVFIQKNYGQVQTPKIELQSSEDQFEMPKQEQQEEQIVAGFEGDPELQIEKDERPFVTGHPTNAVAGYFNKEHPDNGLSGKAEALTNPALDAFFQNRARNHGRHLRISEPAVPQVDIQGQTISRPRDGGRPGMPRVGSRSDAPGNSAEASPGEETKGYAEGTGNAATP